MQAGCIALRAEGFLGGPSLVTGGPGVPWPRATRRRPRAGWHSRASVTGTAGRKRSGGEGDGRTGRPARRPQSARRPVSTVWIPAVEPQSDAKPRPRARRSLGRPAGLGGPTVAARSWAPRWSREGRQKHPPALVGVRPRGSSAGTAGALSWRGEARGAGRRGPPPGAP